VVDIRKDDEYVVLGKRGYDVLALKIRYSVVRQMHASKTDARMIYYELRISFSSELSNAANCCRYDEIRLLLFLFL
jgi:hypothetical protein